MGLFQQTHRGGVIVSSDRKNRLEWLVPNDKSLGAEEGDIVVAEEVPSKGGNKGRASNEAKILKILGRYDSPKVIVPLTLEERNIPSEFPKALLSEANSLNHDLVLGQRLDLRSLPFVTIDGEDARDFDDAVLAEPDPSPTNQYGWRIIVAIADVAHYVTPGGAIDREAYHRGNSVYLPGTVIPMLPEVLSNYLCSLKPQVDRATLTCHMTINRYGKLIGYEVHRSLIRSFARMTYAQVQALKDENQMPKHIEHLYGALSSLLKNRNRRGTLDLDVPERKIKLDESGNPIHIQPSVRLDSHRLIEEMMILANVATALVLESKNAPCVYRVHDVPPEPKINALRETLKGLGFNLEKGQVLSPKLLMKILNMAEDTPHRQMVSDLILRSQAQAVYSTNNLGHFGLNLPKYAHFTSPIRRYSDLLVHRSLIAALKLGEGGLGTGVKIKEDLTLQDMAHHISQTERRAALAERDANERFTALFLENMIGQTFDGVIASVTSFGFFVHIQPYGADGLVSLSSLKDDYYVYDEVGHQLIGQRLRRTYTLGQNVKVLLKDTDTILGRIGLEIVTPPKKASLKNPKSKDSEPPKSKGKKSPAKERSHKEHKRRPS